MRAAALIGALAIGATGCGSCGGCGGSSALRVEGPTPFVRCLAAEPPAARTWKAGGAELALAEHGVLSVKGLEPPVRIAVTSGPAPAPEVPKASLATLRGRAPDLIVVLGDVGDGLEAATAALSALGGLGPPVLVLAGGRDEAEVLSDAIDALEAPAAERVVDARALRRIVLPGGDELLPVSGAPGGRYARTEEACGYRADDLEDRADDLGEAEDARRWVLGWAAPAGPHAAGRGFGGVEAGDPAMAELAEAVGARGGLFAWPRTQAGRLRGPDGAVVPPGRPAERGWLVVPPLAGPAAVRADGSRVAAEPTVVVLGPEGLTVEPPADGAAASAEAP